MSRAILFLASSDMVALPFFICSCRAAMSACFFSMADFLGVNLVLSSDWAFWPSLVCRIAFCTWMIATLDGAAAWACASEAIPRAITENATKFFFKLETPKCENTTILKTGGLEGPSDRETEHRPLLEERERLAE